MHNDQLSIWTIYYFTTKEAAAKFAADHHTFFDTCGSRYTVTLYN